MTFTVWFSTTKYAVKTCVSVTDCWRNSTKMISVRFWENTWTGKYLDRGSKP